MLSIVSPVTQHQTNTESSEFDREKVKCNKYITHSKANKIFKIENIIYFRRIIIVKIHHNTKDSKNWLFEIIIN